jgi:hypothetical protein
MTKTGLFIIMILLGSGLAFAGDGTGNKGQSGNIYRDLPGVKTPPPVTTLGSKSRNCVPVQAYEHNAFTGRRMPTLAYRCTEGNVDFYSTLPPAP